MTEFKSFTFEKQTATKQTATKQTLIWSIIAGLFALGVISIILNVATFWSSILFIFLPFLLVALIQFKAIKFGAHEELNGIFKDELTINNSEIKIAENSIPIERIKSISIIYNNIYGTKRYSPYSGTSRLNGETNLLKIELTDNKLLQYNFRLKSIEHAKQLIELTEFLKDTIIVKNDWKINYNA